MAAHCIASYIQYIVIKEVQESLTIIGDFKVPTALLYVRI